MPTIDLPDDELAALTTVLRRLIKGDPYLHAPRLDPLKAALARLGAARTLSPKETKSAIASTSTPKAYKSASEPTSPTNAEKSAPLPKATPAGKGEKRSRR